MKHPAKYPSFEFTSDVRRSNLTHAQYLFDLLKSSFGPEGRAKIFLYNRGLFNLTSNGGEMIKEIDRMTRSPALKLILKAGKTQRDNIGDGVIATVLLTGALLKNAEKLLNLELHPTTIIKGYQMATKRCLDFLDGLAFYFPHDNSEVLRKVAFSSLKNFVPEKERIASLIVDAVKCIKKEGGAVANKDEIRIEAHYSKESGADLIFGTLIKQKRMREDLPKKIENARILALDFPLDCFMEIEMASRVPAIASKAVIFSIEQKKAFLKQRETMLRDAITKIINIGTDVVFCKRGTGELAAYYLAKNGVWAYERVSLNEFLSITKSTGAEIVASIDELSPRVLGKAKLVEEMVYRDIKATLIKAHGDAKTASILIRINSRYVLEEVTQNVKNAIAAVCWAIYNGRVLPGGGITEVFLAEELEKFSLGIEDKTQLAIVSFAKALRAIPEILAQNSGKNPLKFLAFRSKGNLDKNPLSYGLLEPYSLKVSSLKIASDTAISILRIEDCLPKKCP